MTLTAEIITHSQWRSHGATSCSPGCTRLHGSCAPHLQVNGQQSPEPPTPVLPRVIEQAAIEPLRTNR